MLGKFVVSGGIFDADGAAQFCQQQGRQLAKIHSQADCDEVGELIGNTAAQRGWIGCVPGVPAGAPAVHSHSNRHAIHKHPLVGGCDQAERPDD